MFEDMKTAGIIQYGNGSYHGGKFQINEQKDVCKARVYSTVRRAESVLLSLKGGWGLNSSLLEGAKVIPIKFVEVTE